MSNNHPRYALDAPTAKRTDAKITHYLLLVTHYSLLITHYSLLITCFFAWILRRQGLPPTNLSSRYIAKNATPSTNYSVNAMSTPGAIKQSLAIHAP